MPSLVESARCSSLFQRVERERERVIESGTLTRNILVFGFFGSWPMADGDADARSGPWPLNLKKVFIFFPCGVLYRVRLYALRYIRSDSDFRALIYFRISADGAPPTRQLPACLAPSPTPDPAWQRWVCSAWKRGDMGCSAEGVGVQNCT